MRVLCAGLMVCDILIKPVSWKTLRADTSAAESILLYGGGDAFNVAVNLASLGIETSLVGGVGKDALGRWLSESAQSSGVDISHLKYGHEPTSASAVLIQKNGDRNFVSYKGACHTLSEHDISDTVLRGYDLLYVGSAFDLPRLDGKGMERLFERAHTAGLVTVLDTTADPKRRDFDRLAPALRHVDMFLPSKREALALSGKPDVEGAADFFHAHGSKIVVIKLGDKGCLVSQKGCKERYPAYRAEAVDTTGAGDAFVSGFIAAYIRRYSIGECARIGNAAGAVCVGHMGATGALHDFDILAGMARIR